MITASASTSEPLASTTTAELLADMQSSSVKAFSGTVVMQMSLGLPQLPAIAGDRGEASPATLLAGSHTMRVWYGGAEKQRIALLGQTSETDVFHSGRDVWEWDSDTHVATHTVLPAHTASATAHPARPSSAESLTPQQLATHFLSAIDPTTAVTLGANRSVADRSAYDLVLTPKGAGTKIGSVHIAVDGSTKLPLGVQVYARGAASPSVDVAFSDISFKAPPQGYFAFVPPLGSTVHSGSSSSAPSTDAQAPAGRATTVGTGWSSVVVYRSTPAELNKAIGPLTSALTSVHGTWGQGRLLDSTLFSALITTDGRVYAGAVDPQALYAAASTH